MLSSPYVNRQHRRRTAVRAIVHLAATKCTLNFAAHDDTDFRQSLTQLLLHSSTGPINLQHHQPQLQLPLQHQVQLSIQPPIRSSSPDPNRVTNDNLKPNSDSQANSQANTQANINGNAPNLSTYSSTPADDQRRPATPKIVIDYQQHNSDAADVQNAD